MLLDNIKVTILNRYDTAGGEIIWYPTIVNGHLIVDKNAAQTRTGLSDADAAQLHIDYTVKDGKIYVGGKRYLPPKQWERQVNEDLPKSLTFDDGLDFFLVGEHDAGPANDADYGRNGYIEYLRKIYDDLYAITSVGKYTLIPHFEIGGR